MSKMTGHRYFAEAMKGYGVPHWFCAGKTIPPLAQTGHINHGDWV